MRSSGNAAVFVGVGLFLLLPILYVLSLGPAVLLVERGIVKEHMAEVVYYPLILLAENCEPVETALTSYIKLWEVPPAAPPASTVRTPNPAPAPVRAYRPPPVQP